MHEAVEPEHRRKTKGALVALDALHGLRARLRLGERAAPAEDDLRRHDHAVCAEIGDGEHAIHGADGGDPGEHRDGADRSSDACAARPSVTLQLPAMQAHVARGEDLPQHPGEIRRADRDARGEEQRDADRAPHGEEAARCDEREGDLLVPREVPLARGRRCADRLGEERGRAEANAQRLLGARAHAVEALHAALVDDHAVIAHLFMHAHVRRADGGAMPALRACVAHTDAHGRQFVERREEPAVRAAVGAVALRTEQIHGGEPADEEERKSDEETGERRPEIAGDELGGEARPLELGTRVRRDGEAVDHRPEEHVDRKRERHPEEQPRAEQPRTDARPLHEVPAEILQHDHVAAPAAEPAAEERRRQQRQREEDGPDGDDPVLGRLHRLAWLDRGDGRARPEPLDDVHDHEELDDDEHGRAAPAHPRMRRARALRLMIAAVAELTRGNHRQRERDGAGGSRGSRGARVSIGSAARVAVLLRRAHRRHPILAP